MKWKNCDFCSWGSAGMLLRADGTLVVAADLPVGGSLVCPEYKDGCQPYGDGNGGKEGHVVVLDKVI